MILNIIFLLVSIIGVLGTLIPGLPGTPLILIAIIVYSFLTGFVVIGLETIVLLLVLVLLSQGVEYLTVFLSTKYFGGSKYGIVGSVVGGILALVVMGPIGLLLGPMLGAIIGEFLKGSSLREATKVGLGTFAGGIGASIFSFIIGVIIFLIILNRVLAVGI
ncbi:DUF456 domain-containing protein [Halonatronum saccharophilum]|uniref:DUF456 domain-containing protein n=1 Tax=Halonatronum saccharophilum TaxID=150060 RepID=UPI0004848EDE|nr:DUF456 domain-containing protein [Halonatronum saccharophilum]